MYFNWELCITMIIALVDGFQFHYLKIIIVHYNFGNDKVSHIE